MTGLSSNCSNITNSDIKRHTWIESKNSGYKTSLVYNADEMQTEPVKKKKQESIKD